MNKVKDITKNVIIVTHSWDESLRLHNHVDSNRGIDINGEYGFAYLFEKAMYAHDKQIYNKFWYWYIDDKGSLSGSSGLGSMNNTERITGIKDKVNVDTFISMSLWTSAGNWKIKNDPFMCNIMKEDGINAVFKSGYFIDTTTSPDDIDYMLDIPTTPLANAMTNVRNVLDPVVLLCTGSFCPPHQGHVDMMEAAKTAIELTGKSVIAGYFSPGHDEYITYKTGEKSIPIHKRIQLCEKICPSWVSVDPWEGLFNKHAIMFTHVVERLERYLEKHLRRNVQVVFVCGADNQAYMNAFLKKGHCVVVGRPGFVSPGKSNDKRYTYAYCNNPMSSTQLREQTEIKPIEKVNLTIRVEDTIFESIGASYGKLLDIVTSEYDKVTIHYLSDQLEEFKNNMSKVGPIVSLDALVPDVEMPNVHSIRLSRYYDMFGSKMLRFATSPEAKQTLLRQITSIPKNPFYIFDDDIHTAGGTIRFVSGWLDRVGIVTKGIMSFKVSDDSQGEILDLRDFLIHGENCGLVVQMPDKTGVRVPYIYPYACPYARASVTNPMEFSIKVWEFNRDFHYKAGTLVKDLCSMGRLFVYAGMANDDEPVAAVCQRHIRLLNKLKR